MKNCVFAILVTLCVGCDIQTNQSVQHVKQPDRMLPGEWYEGGSLHGVTIKDWGTASQQNKLATIADQVAALLEYDQRNPADMELDAIEKAAQSIVEQLDQISQDQNNNDRTVASLTASVYFKAKHNTTVAQPQADDPVVISLLRSSKGGLARIRKAVTDQLELQKRAAIEADNIQKRLVIEAENQRRHAAAAADRIAKIALVMGQSFVKQHLKSPSTADFGGLFSGEFQDARTCVRSLGNGEYRVQGWVDSQNGFGAMVRSQFYVKIKYAGDDNTWLLVEPPLIITP